MDANSHRTGILVGGLGKTGYSQIYTGTGLYTVYATTGYHYDAAGRQVKIVYPISGQATSTYDAKGELTIPASML